MGIVGLIVVTFIWNCFGTGIVCSGVGVGTGVNITSGAREIACCGRLAMDSTALVVLSP